MSHCPGCDGDHLPNHCESCVDWRARALAAERELQSALSVLDLYHDYRREAEAQRDAARFLARGWRRLAVKLGGENYWLYKGRG